MRIARSLLVSVAILLASTLSALAQTGPIYCNGTGSAFPTSATTTKVINKVATGTGRTFICGWHVHAAGGSIQLVYGTQTTTPCDTGQVVISPLYPAAAVGDDQSSNWRGVLVPNGNDVCVVTGAGTTSAEALAYFAQQ
ncbi:MAG: hypothetical protein EPO02_13355 [Nitrospirae bacterium]|nr:MAG: hypothetical protein EPO02_13355 [Nitrospirota bacterium]